MRQNFNGFIWVCQDCLTQLMIPMFCLFELNWQGRLDSNQRMARSKPAALPLGDAPKSMLCLMAGAAGFEPTDGEIKTRCLTTWRRP